MIIFGKVRDGQVKIQRFFKNDLNKLEGCDVEIVKVSSLKTLQQLRYLWGVVYRIISEHTGFTPEEVSEVYKKKFLTYQKEHKGKVYDFARGLSILKKEEAAEFIKKVINHAQTELELIIPEPDDEFEYPNE